MQRLAIAMLQYKNRLNHWEIDGVIVLVNLSKILLYIKGMNIRQMEKEVGKRIACVREKRENRYFYSFFC